MKAASAAIHVKLDGIVGREDGKCSVSRCGL